MISRCNKLNQSSISEKGTEILINQIREDEERKYKRELHASLQSPLSTNYSKCLKMAAGLVFSSVIFNVIVMK